MSITVGISRIVILDSYPEDGIEILKQAQIEVSKLEKQETLSWIANLDSTKM
jgi:hypothetical protein